LTSKQLVRAYVWTKEAIDLGSEECFTDLMADYLRKKEGVSWSVAYNETASFMRSTKTQNYFRFGPSVPDQKEAR
jgi:hypothetical protein